MGIPEYLDTLQDDFESLFNMAKQVVDSPTSKAAHAALKNAVESNKVRFMDTSEGLSYEDEKQMDGDYEINGW